jgi:hypothetical protein
MAWPTRAPFRALADDVKEIDDDLLAMLRALAPASEWLKGLNTATKPGSPPISPSCLLHKTST